jgi:hypothetical protein
MKILFVSGFNSHPNEQPGDVDIYSSFDIYFKFSKNKLEHFRYKTTENLHYVYERLYDVLKTKKHDLVICHSMGCCLAMKYIHETNDKREFIMCMPYIHVSSFIKLLSNIPLIQYLYIPKCCLAPNHILIDAGNIFNDELRFVRCNQIHTAINDFFLPEEKLIQTINSNNIHIIYSENEFISPIESHILSQIKRDHISYSKGKHISFSNTYHMSNFFDVFTTALKKII